MKYAVVTMFEGKVLCMGPYNDRGDATIVAKSTQETTRGSIASVIPMKLSTELMFVMRSEEQTIRDSYLRGED